MTNKKRFGIGDIVKLKLLGDAHYYIITDFIDFSTEDKLSVDYEIVLIYPIQKNPPIEIIAHDELEIVSKFGSRDYTSLIDFIIRERQIHKFHELPKAVEEAIMLREVEEYEIKNHIIKPVTQSTKDFKMPTMKEIKKMLNSTKAEERIKNELNNLNNLLDLLSESIKNKNEKDIKVYKEKLEVVRRKLIELEYFSLHK